MSDRVPASAADALPIAAVEREVGIGKDRLRVWERRYGFPAPIRDAHGDRLYPRDQVARLQLIKRLLDRGEPPRRLLTLSPAELARTLGPDRGVWHPVDEIHDAVEMLREERLRDLERWLRQSLLRDGLERFVLGAGRGVVDAISNAWEAGALSIWHEHYFSELFSGLLHSALAPAAAGGRGPTVLLATPSGERHGLGLLMAHALFGARGAACLSLGTDIPNAEIVSCAAECAVDVVALSISVGYPSPRAVEALGDLRARLPPATAIWVGGRATTALARRRAIGDIRLLDGLEAGLAGLDGWPNGPRRS